MVLLFFTSLSAVAAPINYGDFIGDTVAYLGVTEDSNSGDTPPLYGAPTVSGDSLDFDPVGFDANATGANGVDITDGQIKFMVQAKQNKVINSLTISEAGDTTLAGGAAATDATFTSVQASGILDIFEVNGVGVNNISVPISLVFTPSGGDYKLRTDSGTPAGAAQFHTLWSGTQSFDLNAILASNNIDGEVTKVGINMDNTLVALSEAGSSSLIAKKDFGGLSITVNGPNPNPIPEPTAGVLAIFGMIGLAAAGRRTGR